MIKKTGILFVLAALLVIYSSCKKKDTTLFSLSATWGGAVHNYTSADKPFIANAATDSSYFGIDGVQSTASSIAISIPIPAHGSAVASFSLNPTSKALFDISPDLADDLNNTVLGSSGTVSITAYDSIAKTISGTFSGRFYEAGTTTYIDVTNGSFSASYQYK